MQKTEISILVAVALVSGAVLGAWLYPKTDAASVEPSTQPTEQSSVDMGTHVMPDGTVMANNGTTSEVDHSTMSMDEMMQAMNAELAGKTGEEFDEAFLEEMIVHHQGAVEMAELALENAEHQEIKDLAEAIITAQEKEIADMQQWQEEWGY